MTTPTLAPFGTLWPYNGSRRRTSATWDHRSCSRAEPPAALPAASHLSGSALGMGPAVMCGNSAVYVCGWCLTRPLTGFLLSSWNSSISLWLSDKKIKQKCQNEQPRKLAMVPGSALKTTTTNPLPITQSSEHNWLVPRSTIKGNQKYFSLWLFMNQPLFFFRHWRSQNQIMWSHRTEIPISPPAHPFFPVLC